MSKLSTRTKFAYGVGQVGEQIKVSGFDIFVFFYFQQVLGLSGMLAGAAVAIALVFDAVTDPLAGALSDSWKSPRGRRHPFMYVAALPLAVFWFLLFIPPAGLGQMGLFLWLTTFAILVRGAMTLYHVPHMAMGAELSDDYVERTSVVAWRVFFAVAGALMVSVIALTLFFPSSEQYKNGLLNPAGYPKVALFGSIAMALTIWYSAWGTRDQIPRLPKAPENAPKITLAGTFGEVWKGYRDATSLVSFRSVFAGAACFTVAYGITQTLQTHLSVFFWEFSPKQYAALRMAILPGFFLGIALTRFAHRRFDKKACAIFGMVIITAGLHTPVLLRLLGVLPHHGGGALLLIVGVFLAFGGVAGGIAITTANSMMADVAQELEYKTGRPQQGVAFSAIALAQKLGSASGHMVAGIGVDLIAFPTQATDISSIDPTLIAHLGMLYLSASLVGFAGVYAYTRYDLTYARHLETHKALQARKLAATEGSQSMASETAAAAAADELDEVVSTAKRAEQPS